MNKDAMNPEEFANEMYKIVTKYAGDAQVIHIAMDGIMCELLTALGYDEGVKVFQRAPKHYA